MLPQPRSLIHVCEGDRRLNLMDAHGCTTSPRTASSLLRQSWPASHSRITKSAASRWVDPAGGGSGLGRQARRWAGRSRGMVRVSISRRGSGAAQPLKSIKQHGSHRRIGTGRGGSDIVQSLLGLDGAAERGRILSLQRLDLPGLVLLQRVDRLVQGLVQVWVRSG